MPKLPFKSYIFALAAVLSIPLLATCAPPSSSNLNSGYYIIYNGNGAIGAVPIDDTNYRSGASVTVKGNTGSLVKAGSTFDGWNTAADGSGTSYAPDDKLIVGNANVTLYAQWLSDVTFIYVTTDGNAVRTRDGTSWTVSSTGLASCTDLVYGASGFVACGKDSSGYIAVATSTDGDTWTVKVVDNVNTALVSGYLSVRPSDGAVVMTYESGVTVYAATSLNGWTTTNATGISSAGYSSVYMNDGWYMSSSNGSGWRKTTDGLIWSTATMGSASMYNISLRAYVGGVFFVGGSNNPSSAARSIYRSTNYGVAFGSLITLPCSTSSSPFKIVQTSTGRLVEFGSGADTDRVCYSGDLGLTWTSVAITGAATFNGASVTPWGIYAGTAAGTVYASTDNGVTFSAVTVPTSAAIVAMSVNSF